MPIIRLIEGSGGGGSVKTIETTGRANLPGGLTETTVVRPRSQPDGRRFRSSASASARSPAWAPRGWSAAHYSVMVKEIAAVFVAGPPVVERLGEPRTKQELGGWEIQLGCGAVDDAVDTEEEAFDAARRFLSYLPGSIHDVPPRAARLGRSEPRRRGR